MKLFIVFLLLVAWTAGVRANEANCGPVANDDGVGPWDYRDPANHRPSGDAPKGRVKIVEGRHFTPQVERLESGKTGSVAGDISYTLKRFPNHPRALFAISKYVRLGGSLGRDEQGRLRNVECYFDRALRFAPDDPAVHMIFAIHLHLTHDMARAEQEYLKAESLAPDDVELKYNIGLYYFDAKNFEKALKYAKIAYKGEYPLSGLKEKLKSINKWP